MVSSRVEEIVIGMVLGDSHLAMLKQDARLEIGHSEKQKDYVFWKHKELSQYVSSNPHYLINL